MIEMLMIREMGNRVKGRSYLVARGPRVIANGIYAFAGGVKQSFNRASQIASSPY